MMRTMKRVVTGVVLAFAMAASFSHAASRGDLWKKVDEAVSKGLPRTAITNLNEIIPGAIQAKAWGEATKAVARKIALEGNIQGNKPEEKITRMEVEIAQAPPEIVPLLRALEADWYWQYFQQNKWRFMRRTATAEPPGKGFTTWDLPRLFAEIDKVFDQALSASNQLQRIPVADFSDVLVKGTVPDDYRPTLYDFIAHEALDFYTSGEQAAAKPENAFEISADSPIFGNTTAFLDWKPETTQTNAPALKAIRRYQDLLRVHRKDTNPTAFLAADLERLVYGHNVAFGESKDTRYRAALQAFVAQWLDNEVSSLALYQWARSVKDDGNLVEARKLAQRGENAHRDSVGGKMCHNLVAEIEAPSLRTSTERVWNCGSTTGGEKAAKQSARDRTRPGRLRPTKTSVLRSTFATAISRRSTSARCRTTGTHFLTGAIVGRNR